VSHSWRPGRSHEGHGHGHYRLFIWMIKILEDGPASNLQFKGTDKKHNETSALIRGTKSAAQYAPYSVQKAGSWAQFSTGSYPSEAQRLELEVSLQVASFVANGKDSAHAIFISSTKELRAVTEASGFRLSSGMGLFYIRVNVKALVTGSIAKRPLSCCYCVTDSV
jgi:hypothetical protein